MSFSLVVLYSLNTSLRTRVNVLEVQTSVRVSLHVDGVACRVSGSTLLGSLKLHVAPYKMSSARHTHSNSLITALVLLCLNEPLPQNDVLSNVTSGITQSADCDHKTAF